MALLLGSIIQRQFKTTYNLKAIPDISIQINNFIILVEVKIDSKINEYQLPRNPQIIINQIEKYQGILLQKSEKMYLHTLTRSSANIDFKKSCKDFCGEILWHEIYSLIQKYQTDNQIEAYFHNEFLKFMEDNRMGNPKVSYELVNGMQSLLNLYDQIEIVLKDLKIPYSTSFGSKWTGYYIFRDDKKSDKNYGFIGIYWETDKLTFLFSNEKAKNKISNEEIEGQFQRQVDNKLFCKYFIFEDEHYFCLKPDKQIEKLKDWVNNNYNLLNRLSV
ncbi:MAG: hypothetical protein HQ565_04805 [Bacteroidetes bacterium]|nr:hypothetical protein [Bacteroidota bacterium]